MVTAGREVVCEIRLMDAGPWPLPAIQAATEWSIWRWVAGALAQDLAYRHARLSGGDVDVGDRREQCVLPEVVSLPPPGDLIKEVRFGPAVESCSGWHCVLGLLVLPPAEGALGQEALA